jgi:hypothetical protein
MKEQSLAIDMREDVLFPEERPTVFHFSHRQPRRSARLASRLLDSSRLVQTNSRDMSRAMATFLRQRYEDATMNRECLSCMEQEEHMAVPAGIRCYLEGEITEMELYTAVRQGAPNKSQGLDGVSLEFYKKYWGIITMICCHCTSRCSKR